MAFSPDGRKIATASMGQYGPGVGSGRDGRTSIVLRGHEGGVMGSGIQPRWDKSRHGFLRSDGSSVGRLDGAADTDACVQRTRRQRL